MKLVPFLAFLTFLVTIGVTPALSTVSHPTDSSAVNIGDETTDTTVSASVTDHVHVWVSIWRIGSVRTEPVIDLATAAFSGTGGNVDTVQTTTLLSRIRESTIRTMIDKNYLTCSSTPDTVI